MLTYHNSKEIKQKYIARMKAHMAADELVQGVDYEGGKGCAIGCTLDNCDHDKMATELGWPEWLIHWYEAVFKGLSVKDAKQFPILILKAIPEGLTHEQMEQVRHKLAIARLERLIPLLPESSVKKQVVEAIEQVIDYHKSQSEDKRSAVWPAVWSAVWSAESAAWSAESAAWSAARSAAWSAARSDAWSAARSAAWSDARSAAWSVDWSVAWSAKSVAWSAESAAESAANSAESAWQFERYTFLELIKEYNNE